MIAAAAASAKQGSSEIRPVWSIIIFLQPVLSERQNSDPAMWLSSWHGMQMDV
jgi:hypothetical protein